MPRAAYTTDLGIGWVGFTGGEITAITLPGADAPREQEATAPPRVAELLAALEAYYAGRASLLPSSELVAAAATTPLTRAIYEAVSAIPPGDVRTYGDIATAVGRPGAARAVGAAMARNPFPPVIPCHRVVGAAGSLRGYAGGLGQKEALLAMEGARA